MTVVKYENNSYKMFSDPSITSFSERKETKGLEDTWRIFTKNISVCMIYVDIYFFHIKPGQTDLRKAGDRVPEIPAKLAS